MALYRLVKIFAVPVESCAGAETGEQIIESCAASDADDEEPKYSRIEEQAFAVDPFPAIVSLANDA